MSRFDRCPNCEQTMPAGNLHGFGCNEDLQPPASGGGWILVQLYPAYRQGGRA